MEHGFSRDFSGVRVHSDERAARSADALGARAYTVGHNVVFGTGRYRPGSHEGDQTIAHELAHVVQQERTPGGRLQGAVPVVTSEPLEREAHSASEVVSSGGPARITGRVLPGVQGQWENLGIGDLGEQYLSHTLDSLGYVVFHDWGKSVTGRGIDLVVWDPRTNLVWLIDNKAWSRDLYKAPALTGPQFEWSLKKVKEFLFANTASKEAAAALKALNAERYLKVVSNFNAMGETRFSPLLFQRGIVVFDVRMMRLYYNHASWQAAFATLPLRRGVRMTGQRGSATVGSMLIAIVLVGGGLYLYRHASGNVKQIVLEIAAQGALDALLVRIAGPSVGGIASLTLGLKGDRPASVIERDEKVDAIIAGLPELNYDQLTEKEQQDVRKSIGELVDHPLVIPDPPPLTYPVAPAAGASLPNPNPPPPPPSSSSKPGR